MKIDLIAGARPNFIKIASILNAILEAQSQGQNIEYRLIHTGQHYDKNMSDSFFDQLGIPDPHFNLGAGGGTQSEQAASIMIGYEKLILLQKPDICLVVGDVTSTMACAIVAQKLHVFVAHVEAGIRSLDWTMPEEINRLVTDSITNFFFTTTPQATKTLLASGISQDRIFWVGNTMIDTLLLHKPRFIKPEFYDQLSLKERGYIVMTLHRPSNVDHQENLKIVIDEIVKNSREIPIIFPVHPRTLKILKSIGIEHENLFMIEPMPYLEFNFLVQNAKIVITDSGGITEETTVMGVPCVTLRNSTERPETVNIGTNELIGTNPESIKPALEKLFSGNWKKGSIPELWDGNTGKRIVDVLLNLGIEK